MDSEKTTMNAKQKQITTPFGTLALPEVSVEAVIKQAIAMPCVRIDRASFLRTELSRFCQPNIVDYAIAKNPAQAGITRELIGKIADTSITNENMKVTGISALSGIPGGMAMAVSIPADFIQYFGFVLRILQKLLYLYGFDELEFDGMNINDESMTCLTVFLGAMFGISEAAKGISLISKLVAERTAKSLSRKALTKTTIYPIVKKIAQMAGVKMTKQIFAKSVAKIVPVLGALTSGSITFVSFLIGANRLKDVLSKQSLSDPDFYAIEEEKALIEDS